MYRIRVRPRLDFPEKVNFITRSGNAKLVNLSLSQ